MRVTLVIATLTRGGGERVLTTLAAAWAQQGKEVTLITLDRGEPAYAIDQRVQLQRLGVSAPSKNIFHGLRQNLHRIGVLRRAIRESKPDIVISFLDTVNVLTLIATLDLKRPIVISERISPVRWSIGPVWSTLRRLVYRFADELVCQTESALHDFHKMTGVSGRVIPNMVAVPAPFVGGAGKRTKGSTAHILIAIGRLTWQKGFDLLLQAFSCVAHDHPDWSVKIFGEGPLRATLEQQARALKIDGRVCLPGQTADPFRQLCSADLFVLSSRAEGFPNVLCEAMACGLPAVSFDCPSGPGEIIRHGVDGILVPAEDVDALAAALDRLMADPEERKKLAARAPEVVTRFSSEKVLAQWQEVFQLITNER